MALHLSNKAMISYKRAKTVPVTKTNYNYNQQNEKIVTRFIVSPNNKNTKLQKNKMNSVRNSAVHSAKSGSSRETTRNSQVHGNGHVGSNSRRTVNPTDEITAKLIQRIRHLKEQNDILEKQNLEHNVKNKEISTYKNNINKLNYKYKDLENLFRREKIKWTELSKSNEVTIEKLKMENAEQEKVIDHFENVERKDFEKKIFALSKEKDNLMKNVNNNNNNFNNNLSSDNFVAREDLDNLRNHLLEEIKRVQYDSKSQALTDQLLQKLTENEKTIKPAIKTCEKSVQVEKFNLLVDLNHELNSVSEKQEIVKARVYKKHPNLLPERRKNFNTSPNLKLNIGLIPKPYPFSLSENQLAVRWAKENYQKHREKLAKIREDDIKSRIDNSSPFISQRIRLQRAWIKEATKENLRREIDRTLERLDSDFEMPSDRIEVNQRNLAKKYIFQRK